MPHSGGGGQEAGEGAGHWRQRNGSMSVAGTLIEPERAMHPTPVHRKIAPRPVDQVALLYV